MHTTDKDIWKGWRREYKWWGGVAARQTCQAWCMGFLSSRTKCIIKNTKTTCQYVLLWAHVEQNWWASVSSSQVWTNFQSCGVCCMAQVCVCEWVKQTMTTEKQCLKVRFRREWRAAQQGPVAITAQQSQALSPGLCNITSMNLKIKL